jgi:hypothetical protein
MLFLLHPKIARPRPSVRHAGGGFDHLVLTGLGASDGRQASAIYRSVEGQSCHQRNWLLRLPQEPEWGGVPGEQLYNLEPYEPAPSVPPTPPDGRSSDPDDYGAPRPPGRFARQVCEIVQRLEARPQLWRAPLSRCLSRLSQAGWEERNMLRDRCPGASLSLRCDAPFLGGGAQAAQTP